MSSESFRSSGCWRDLGYAPEVCLSHLRIEGFHLHMKVGDMTIIHVALVRSDEIMYVYIYIHNMIVCE